MKKHGSILPCLMVQAVAGVTMWWLLWLSWVLNFERLLPAGYHTMSESSNHLELVSWTSEWVQCTQMTSAGARSQSNRSTLVCGETGDGYHDCAPDKAASTVWRYHVNMCQNLWGTFSSPCWIYTSKNYCSSEGKNRSNVVVALDKELYCVLLCFSLHSVISAFDSFCYPAFTYEILYLFIQIK